MRDKTIQKVGEKFINSGTFKKGHIVTNEMRKKISLGNKGKRNDEKNVNWKGDNASYFAIHIWLQAKLGKGTYCSFDKTHKSKKFEWASISRKALRDINDYMSLCLSCHRKYDLTNDTREKMRLMRLGKKHKKESNIKNSEIHKELWKLYGRRQKPLL